MILKLLGVKWNIKKNYGWCYLWMHIIFTILFLYCYFESPLACLVQKNLIPPLKISPLPLKIPKLLSYPQSRIERHYAKHMKPSGFYDDLSSHFEQGYYIFYLRDLSIRVNIWMFEITVKLPILSHITIVLSTFFMKLWIFVFNLLPLPFITFARVLLSPIQNIGG